MLTEAMESYGEIDDLQMMPSHWFFPYTWKYYKNVKGRRKVKRVMKEAMKTTKEDCSIHMEFIVGRRYGHEKFKRNLFTT